MAYKVKPRLRSQKKSLLDGEADDDSGKTISKRSNLYVEWTDRCRIRKRVPIQSEIQPKKRWDSFQRSWECNLLPLDVLKSSYPSGFFEPCLEVSVHP